MTSRAYAQGYGIALAMDAAPGETKRIIEQYDRKQISRTKAFEALRKLGHSTDDIRALLGDTDNDGGL